LYYRGKENKVNILNSIDEGPFQMGTIQETLAEGTQGAPHLGPERPREPLAEGIEPHLGSERPMIYSGLSPEEKDWFNADIQATNVLLQGLPKDIYTLINHYTDAKDIWNNVKMLLEAQENGVALDVEQLLFLAGGQDNTIDDDVDEQPVQDLALNDLELNMDNVFQADDYDAFDSDVDETLTIQTMFMANLLSVDLVTDEAGPSYDSNILSEVQDHDHYQDAVLHIMKNTPKPYYNELNKVAIVYKNPLCLTRTKQVQPALYNGHEIIKDNHVPTIVHNTKDTLEIAEISMRKMNDKIKDPECVTHKVKIAPHDYSKENFLATFTPQKQLTPEQIFWSQDLIKLKSEALKEQTTVSRPIKALTVYPPNTPATFVPRVLPTKSQVKNHIFTLIHLFLEFDKTCKKRITPTWLTEGERGFEQTKECYLKEDIYTLINHYTDAKDIWDDVKMLLEGSKLTKEDRESQLPRSSKKRKVYASMRLSSKEEKSSCFRPFSSIFFIFSHARLVINSRLVQNSVSPTPYVPPSKKDYEILFQQLFDEYFNPPPRAVSPALAAVVAPRVVDPAGSPSSTTIDQDVSFASTSPTTHEIQSQVTHQGAKEQIHGHQNAQFDNAPLLHNLSSDPSSKETTLQWFIHSNSHHLNQSFDTLTKLTMNHPLENVICDPSRSVLTRSQLQGHAIWCYFNQMTI
nr:hypothetical protein [Tanacetum cinerariifolium]